MHVHSFDGKPRLGLRGMLSFHFLKRAMLKFSASRNDVALPEHAAMNPLDWFLAALLTYSAVKAASCRGCFREAFALAGLVARPAVCGLVLCAHLAAHLTWTHHVSPAIAQFIRGLYCCMPRGDDDRSRTLHRDEVAAQDRDRQSALAFSWTAFAGAAFGLVRGCLLGDGAADGVHRVSCPPRRGFEKFTTRAIFSSVPRMLYPSSCPPTCVIPLHVNGVYRNQAH